MFSSDCYRCQPTCSLSGASFPVFAIWARGHLQSLSDVCSDTNLYRTSALSTEQLVRIWELIVPRGCVSISPLRPLSMIPSWRFSDIGGMGATDDLGARRSYSIPAVSPACPICLGRQTRALTGYNCRCDRRLEFFGSRYLADPAVLVEGNQRARARNWLVPIDPRQMKVNLRVHPSETRCCTYFCH